MGSRGLSPHRLFDFLRGVRAFVCFGIVGILPAVCSQSSSAAVPTLSYFYPAGGQTGTTVAVTASYKADAWPPQVWSEHPDLKVSPDKAKGKFNIVIGKAVPPGPHLIRIFDKSGASTPRAFVVSAAPSLVDKEPNNGFSTAQLIETLPVVINGKWDKGEDVDSFAIDLKKGQWLTATVDAYSLHSPTDPLLHLLNPDGIRVGFNHDRVENLDPRLAWRAEVDGRHVVQIASFVHPPKADVRFYGGGAAIYRLKLARGDAPTPLEPIGRDESNLPKATEEKEPNDATDKAQRVSPPLTLAGVVSKDGDADRYSFAAKKSEKFEFEVYARRIGSLLDSHLAVTDKTGKRLAENDDRVRDKPDSRLLWTAKADGDYAVVVSDIRRQGAADFHYRLFMGAPRVDFEATVDKNAIALTPGKTAELKVKLTRVNSHKAELKIEIEKLPAGVTVEIDKIPAKTADVKVKLTAAADAKPANLPIRIAVKEVADKKRARFASADLNGDVKGDRLVNRTEQVWLTITPPPKPKEKPKEAKTDAKKK
ncbi:MAG: hypothetical protein ACI8QF_001009 [Limisphaerales bacterium]|jgi:hypothetical protein